MGFQPALRGGAELSISMSKYKRASHTHPKHQIPLQLKSLISYMKWLNLSQVCNVIWRLSGRTHSSCHHAFIKHVIAFSPKFLQELLLKLRRDKTNAHAHQQCARQLSRQPTLSSAFLYRPVYMKRTKTVLHVHHEIWIAADIQPAKFFPGIGKKRPLYSVKDLANSIVVNLQMIFS